MDFSTALIEVYSRTPCQVLPNAFWKTQTKIESGNQRVEIQDAMISHLELWEQDQLMLHWNLRRQISKANLRRLADASLALIHHDYISAVPDELFSHREHYFRLWATQAVKASALPRGFAFAPVNHHTEASLAASVIRQCYAGISLSTETVKGWTQHPVYDPSLWVWVVDLATDSPVGIGIAEFDPAIREGSLEWIQVLPEYRGRGLGTSIVNQLAARLSIKSQFITVSGQVENRTHPERLYRKCGFKGTDTWWILRP